MEEAMSRKRYPYGIVGPSTIPEVADKVLDEFFEIAERLRIRACLAAGLCLGFVRDGGYIDGDNDLDMVAICTGDERNNLTNALKEHDFNVGRSFPPPHNNAHFHKNRILVDIYFRALGEYYSQFGSVQYKGKSYPVPHPVEKYLSVCYTNWRVKENQAIRYYG